eukprot:6838954-Pyramimonas_sp.AAC.1
MPRASLFEPRPAQAGKISCLSRFCLQLIVSRAVSRALFSKKLRWAREYIDSASSATSVFKYIICILAQGHVHLPLCEGTLGFTVTYITASLYHLMLPDACPSLEGKEGQTNNARAPNKGPTADPKHHLAFLTGQLHHCLVVALASELL